MSHNLFISSETAQQLFICPFINDQKCLHALVHHYPGWALGAVSELVSKKEAAGRKICVDCDGSQERSGNVAAGTRLTQTSLSVPQITALRFAGNLLLSAAYQRQQMSSKDSSLDLREFCSSVNPHRSLKAFVHPGFLFVSGGKKWVKL